MSDNPKLLSVGTDDYHRGVSVSNITLRDLFAAFALSGMDVMPSMSDGECASCANDAYRMAGAMLAEREKP